MDLKQWRCKNNHILGVIFTDGGDIPRLMVYRHAIDMEAETPAEVDLVIGPLWGNMPVACDVPGCGDVKPWEISMEALSALLLRLRPEQMEQLQARLLRGRVKKVQKRKNLARINAE